MLDLFIHLIETHIQVHGGMIILSLIQHHLTAILIGLFCIVMVIPVAILVIDHFRLVGVLNGYEIDC